MKMVRRAGFVAILVGASAWGVSAQNVEVDPLQCWWRTTVGAVRVGEPFVAVLTCAAVETDQVKTVVDESRLEPSVAQFPPFEVLGGSHAADLRDGDRRFFQYEYRLRLMAENMFGKDAAVPETKLSYRIQSRVAQKTSVEGRDQSYILPPLSMRILSLVPADAADIRDAGAETFADVDRRSFRANLLVVVGGVLFALAALVSLLTVVRLVMRARKPGEAADRLVGDGAILRSVSRELSAVQREREGTGWSSELAGRALAALRIVATYALGRRAARAAVGKRVSATSQQSVHVQQQAGRVSLQSAGDVAASTNGATDGRIIVNVGWPRTRQVAVSGAATPRSIADAIARASNGRPGELESMEEALSRFTIAQYGQRGDRPRVDDAALDESLAAAQQLLRRLKVEQTWLMKRLRRQRKPVAAESRAWSR